MDKQAILNAMQEQGVVAVMRNENAEQAIKAAKACIEGGIKLIEITFSVPGADKAIAALTETDAIVGAGTVITEDEAQAAYAAGARFIVSPVLNLDVAAYCREMNLLYIPGCMTPTEMYSATMEGCDAVKLFPCSQYDPSFIKAVHGPLPQLKIMPTGGVNLENTAAWIAAGAFAVGAASNLTKVENGDYAAITERAKAYLQQAAEGKGK